MVLPHQFEKAIEEYTVREYLGLKNGPGVGPPAAVAVEVPVIGDPTRPTIRAALHAHGAQNPQLIVDCAHRARFPGPLRRPSDNEIVEVGSLNEQPRVRRS